MVVLGYIFATLMGATLGLIGAGGSILTVPILVYFLNVPPITATGYSLLLVGATALIGSIQYGKKKQIDFKTVILFAIPSFIAVYITRRYLLPIIPDPLFESFLGFTLSKNTFLLIFFACLMLISSLTMIFDKHTTSKPKTYPPLKKTLLIGFEGAIVGIFTGLIGAGGGFLIIPALVLLAGLEMKIAVGSSLLIIAIKSLIGFIGDLQSGILLDFHLLGGFLTCTIIGMMLGVQFSTKIDGKKLKKTFGWFTLLLGILIILKEL